MFLKIRAIHLKTPRIASQKPVGLGASWTRTIDSAIKTVQKTSDWVVGKSSAGCHNRRFVVVGAGLGAGMTLLSAPTGFSIRRLRCTASKKSASSLTII
jgi:dienelactone hydrolase